MAYYQIPFDLELVEASVQSDGEIKFSHRECEFSLRSNVVSEEMVLSYFAGRFPSPTELASASPDPFDEVTVMMNLGNAVYYQIDSLRTPRVLPSMAISLCYSDTRNGICRYQPKHTQLLSVQIPRTVFVALMEAMDLGESVMPLLNRQEPFMWMKQATPALYQMAVKLSQNNNPHCIVQRHLAHIFVNDTMRYIVDSNRLKKLDNHHVFEKAIAILNHEFAQPPTIAQLARRVGTNETSLKHWFKKELDTTVHQYLIQQRISKAIELITHHDFSISHIAQEVGYSNHGHFAAAFKKELGCTPSFYSNQFR